MLFRNIQILAATSCISEVTGFIGKWLLVMFGRTQLKSDVGREAYELGPPSPASTTMLLMESMEGYGAVMAERPKY